MTSFRPVADFKGLQELPAVPGQFGAVAPLISGPIQTHEVLGKGIDLIVRARPFCLDLSRLSLGKIAELE
jgi:hypothetical protein